MFTGIVQEIGLVQEIRHKNEGLSLKIQAARAARSLQIGGSVAIQGACFTCVERTGSSFLIDVSQETLRKTTLGQFKVGDRLNIELPLRLVDPLGGHLVTGHVDDVGQVQTVKHEGTSRLITFSASPSILRYTVEKGSITVDGVSLTAFNVTDDTFQVALIPHTLRVTTLGGLQPGDRVNLEGDLVGKYIERLLTRPLQDGPTPGSIGDALWASWSVPNEQSKAEEENK